MQKSRASPWGIARDAHSSSGGSTLSNMFVITNVTCGQDQTPSLETLQEAARQAVQHVRLTGNANTLYLDSYPAGLIQGIRTTMPREPDCPEYTKPNTLFISSMCSLYRSPRFIRNDDPNQVRCNDKHHHQFSDLPENVLRHVWNTTSRLITLLTEHDPDIDLLPVPDTFITPEGDLLDTDDFLINSEDHQDRIVIHLSW